MDLPFQQRWRFATTVSRESRVGGELKGAGEEGRAGCWVRLEVAFLVHRASKSAP